MNKEWIRKQAKKRGISEKKFLAILAAAGLA